MALIEIDRFAEESRRKQKAKIQNHFMEKYISFLLLSVTYIVFLLPIYSFAAFLEAVFLTAKNTASVTSLKNIISLQGGSFGESVTFLKIRTARPILIANRLISL